MSVLQRNRVAALGYLLTSKPPGGTRTRRASASSVAPILSSLPSCPALSTPASSEQDIHISKRARVTSAPFVRRNGDLVGHGEAYGDCRHRLHSSKLLPSQVTTLSQPFSATLCKQFSEDRTAIQEAVSELPSSSLQEEGKPMPKAAQLSFRSPVSQPKMLPLQPGLYAPVARPPTSPQISYLCTSGYPLSPRHLTASQLASITAVLEPHRRSPAPDSRPALQLACSSEDEHVLSVHLPGFAPEMVTICVRREDKLAVVADLWHAEANCHHEWLVAFSSRDANVLQTRAQFSADGTLTIHVPRHNENIPRMRGRLR